MEIKIGNNFIGDGHPVFVVAEMSANHDGDKQKAIDMIHIAKEIGANALKLQTYEASSITLKSEKADFLLPPDSPWAEYKSLWDLYSKGSTPYEWHEELFQIARDIDLEIFSTPFDEYGLNFLNKLDIPVFKIASPEINHLPLLKMAAQMSKPIILSSGISNFDDLDLAINYLRSINPEVEIILLKCNSSYPSPIKDSNLRTISDMRDKFNVLSGFSDHTEGSTAALAAVACGASLIEKHFCLPGEESVDSFFSMQPEEFKKLVEKIRDFEVALGSVSYDITESAKQSINGRRSLYVAKDISKGEVITRDNLKCVRPAHSLHPKYYEEILGKHSKKKLKKGDRIELDYFK